MSAQIVPSILFYPLPFLCTEGLFHSIKVVYYSKMKNSCALAVWKTDYVLPHLLKILMLSSLIWFSVHSTFGMEQIILLLKVLLALDILLYILCPQVVFCFCFDSWISHSVVSDALMFFCLDICQVLFRDLPTKQWECFNLTRKF